MRAPMVLVAAACVLWLAWPATSQSAVTIGSDLSSAPSRGIQCGPAAATFALTALAGHTVASPINGVIVRWRVRASGTGVPVALRAIRPGSGGVFTGEGTSTSVTLPSSEAVVGPTATRIPVSIGDVLGLDAPANKMISAFTDNTGAAHHEWSPPLADNETRAPGGCFEGAITQVETLINADIEPDADADGFGDETQDRCPGLPGTVNGCPAADLAVSETASPNPSPVHGQFSYLVQIRNNGPSAAPGGLATVTDTVGPSLTLISANSPGGACALGTVVRCPVAALAPGATSTITMTVRADTEGGRANAATASYVGDTNPANDTTGFTANVVPAPRISAVRVSPKTWRLGSTLPRFSRKPPIGTTISFKLTQAAKATLTFAQPATGRKVGKRCKTLTRANRKKRKCTIPNVHGRLTVSAHAGTNKVRFQGRLSRTKKLKPGRYTLTIGATDSAGNRSNAKSTSFTIVRG